MGTGGPEKSSGKNCGPCEEWYRRQTQKVLINRPSIDFSGGHTIGEKCSPTEMLRPSITLGPPGGATLPVSGTSAASGRLAAAAPPLTRRRGALRQPRGALLQSPPAERSAFITEHVLPHLSSDQAWTGIRVRYWFRNNYVGATDRPPRPKSVGPTREDWR
jgi:hypothetical protein